MADKKLIFRNKYGQNNYGIYHYLENNTSDNYYDSDSIPVRYDKFTGKDLYTTSVGSEVNEAIMSSEMRSSYSPDIDGLQYIGESSFKINQLVIKNTGGNSDVNDVYFHVYIVSHQYAPLKSPTGGWKNHTEMKNLLRANDSKARFWSQTGPDYGENKSPGNIINNQTIFTSFDKLNNEETIALPNSSTSQYYDKFDPTTIFTRTGVASVTTLFQEDGEYNPIYVAVHMDGDMDTTYDKSRNENLCVYEISPEELFDWNGVNPQGAIKTLDFNLPAVCKQSTNQDYAHIWDAKEFSITTNTTGGSILQYTDEDGNIMGNYNPPEEFLKYQESIVPPFQTDMENLNSLILNMFPNRQLVNGVDGTNTSISDIYYGSIIADYLPVVNVDTRNISTTKVNNFQVYYESQEDRSYTSSPNNVELRFYSTLHPFPITKDDVKGGYYFDDNQYVLTLYDSSDYFVEYGGSDDLGFELEDRLKFTGENPVDVTYKRVELEDGGYTDNTTDVAISNDVDYMYLVVDWNDGDNKYKTIEDVLVDWPRTITELNEKKSQNLYYIKTIDETISNNYNTPGIKNIKSIMFSYKHSTTLFEPLRWKLVTTRIFLDIPVNQFPDFGEVGGSDYTTIPWPYTTPVIGGVSKTSKYLKSINETLGGGKIGNQDIIDENFLVTAQENDELGQNIEKMDLEQVRFFNTGSYDMNTLLNIPIENDFYPNPYTNIGSGSYWNGSTPERTFSEKTLVGEIFINDNLDLDLKNNCQLEFNTGNLTGKSIDDSSGKGNKGLLIGDYKVKKTTKGQPMRRDSFIKVPKKTNNKDGAL